MQHVEAWTVARELPRLTTSRGDDLGTVAYAVHRAADGGQSWSEQLTYPRLPAQDPNLVRTPGGRLVALWTDGDVAPVTLRASDSDDDGATWSASWTIRAMASSR